MFPESPSNFLLLLIGCVLAFSGHSASAQSLTSVREWTNTDGKKLKAELLVFGKEADEGIVRLRMSDGVVHKIEEASLSREDRALILKERFKSQFRSNFNARMDAHFFYSKLIPEQDEEESTIAYIGNDEKGGWLRVKVSLKSGAAKDGVALMIVGKGAPPIRIEYGSEDLEFYAGNVQLDLSLTKHSADLATLLESPDAIKFVIEKGDKTYSEVVLSDTELKSLTRVSSAFRKLAELSTDHVWWATFRDLDIDEINARLKAEEEAKMMAAQKPEPEKQQPLTEKLTWQTEATGETFDAVLLGFERQRATFDSRAVPVLELTAANREVLAALRMEHSLKANWHPVDDGFGWYWPKDDSCRNVLIFAVERETGKPRLFLQQKFDIAPTGRPTSARIRGKVVDLDLPFPVSNGAMKLRAETETTVWLPLREEYCEVLMIASPALEGLRFEHQTADGEMKKGDLTEAEFDASVESIEVFRLWHSLVKTVESR